MTFWGLAALAVVLILAAAGYLYTPDLAAGRLAARYDDAATTYPTIAGIVLRLRDTGPRAAPAIFLIHGFGASLDTWEPWAATLSGTYRVLRYDLPGFGLTGPDPTGDYSDTRAIAIHAALMAHLNIAQAHLIGNSLGGRVAWNFAVAHPGRVASLVLVSPDGFASPGFDYDRPPKLPAFLKLLPYTLPRAMLRMNLAVAYGSPRRLNAATLARYHDMMRAPGIRRAILERMSQMMLRDPTARLRRITAPTLLLWGEQDRMIPFGNAAAYLRDLPHAQIAALPGLGHVPFEEAPDAALRPVLAFLAARECLLHHA